MSDAAPTIVGDRFGDRVVLKFRTDARRGRQAYVQCGCGQQKWVLLSDLRAGRSDRCRPCRDKRNGDVLRERLTHGAAVQTLRCPDCGHVFNHKPKDQLAT